MFYFVKKVVTIKSGKYVGEKYEYFYGKDDYCKLLVNGLSNSEIKKHGMKSKKDAETLLKYLGTKNIGIMPYFDCESNTEIVCF